MDMYQITLRVTEAELNKMLKFASAEQLYYRYQNVKDLEPKTQRAPKPAESAERQEGAVERSSFWPIVRQLCEVGDDLRLPDLAKEVEKRGFKPDSASGFMTHCVRQGYFEKYLRTKGVWRRLK